MLKRIHAFIDRTYPWIGLLPIGALLLVVAWIAVFPARPHTHIEQTDPYATGVGLPTPPPAVKAPVTEHVPAAKSREKVKPGVKNSPKHQRHAKNDCSALPALVYKAPKSDVLDQARRMGVGDADMARLKQCIGG